MNECEVLAFEHYLIFNSECSKNFNTYTISRILSLLLISNNFMAISINIGMSDGKFLSIKEAFYAYECLVI